jgi:Glycosyltransferase family 92
MKLITFLVLAWTQLSAHAVTLETQSVAQYNFSNFTVYIGWQTMTKGFRMLEPQVPDSARAVLKTAGRGSRIYGGNCTHVYAVPEECNLIDAAVITDVWYWNRDVEVLWICKPFANSTSSAIEPSVKYGSIAVCVPPLRGTISEKWVDFWLSAWRSNGVNHFFVYESDTNIETLKHELDVTILKATWLKEKWVHQNGQAWAMTDCLYRTRSHGYSWSFFVDLDEIFHAGPFQNVSSLLQSLSSGISCVTFGSVMYNVEECVDGNETASLYDRMVYHTREAQGGNMMKHQWGRRKFVAAVSDWYSLEIHDCSYFTEDRIQHENATGPHIKHYRDAPFTATACSRNDSNIDAHWVI